MKPGASDVFRYFADSAEVSASDDEEEEKRIEDEVHAPIRKSSDWDFAIRFRDIQRLGNLPAKIKSEQSDRAVSAIIERAHALLGPIQKPIQKKLCTSDELMQEIEMGATHELDVEETLVFRDPVFEVRKTVDHGLLLILDTSLSMKGEKLAFLATTVAAAGLAVPSRSLAVLGFDSEIHPIKLFSEDLDLSEIVRRVLQIPPGGFTNMSLGLRTACDWLVNQRSQTRVVMISDGRVTEGEDPILLARKMVHLHAISIGRDPGGRGLMRDIASEGSGQFYEVRDMAELPKVLYQALRTWLR